MKRVLLFIASISLLLQSLSPYAASLSYAQEVTPTPTQAEEPAATLPEPVPTEIPAEIPEEPELTPTLPAEAPTITPEEPTLTPTPIEPLPIESSPSSAIDPAIDLTPQPTAAPSATPVWKDLGSGDFETSDNVVLGEVYTTPQNDKVKVQFTGISGEAGKLSIKEVKLTADQVSQTGALSDTAYEITSTMTDGTFFYDLTLPIPPEAQNKEVDVKSSETVEEAGNAQKVSEPEEKTADTITIHGLNHFTVFVVTATDPVVALADASQTFYFLNQPALLADSHILSITPPTSANSQVTSVSSTNVPTFRHFHPGTTNVQHTFSPEPAHIPPVDSASWITGTPLNGTFQAGNWSFVVHKLDNTGGEFSKPHFNIYSSPSNTSLDNAVFLFHAEGPDWWNNSDEQMIFTSAAPLGEFQFNNEFLVVQLFDNCIADCSGGKTLVVFEDGLTATTQTRLETPLFTPAEVADTTAPVITILGSNPASVNVGEVYSDAGATALDNVDGDITANIVTTGLPVDTAAPGIFTVTYSVSDVAGNLAAADRTVNVVSAPPLPDTTAPVITMLGTSPVDVILGSVYADAGATATDNVDASVTVNAVSTVDTAVIGTYTVTYSAIDSAGNVATPVIRTVNVAAAPPPGFSTRAVSTTNDPDNGYPDWYQDDSGVRVVQCLDGADPNCAMAAEGGFNPANPTVFPDNFPPEFFYWTAESAIESAGVSALLVLAAEAAFLNDEVIAGDQMTFGRIRIRIDVPQAGVYTVSHPFGTEVFNVPQSRIDATGGIRAIDSDKIGQDGLEHLSGNLGFLGDIGCEIAPCDFAAALQSPIFESFLKWDSGAPAGYLGDGVTDHAVIGSPLNQNFFRIEGPGLPAGGIETNLFAVMGKLSIPPVVPPEGCVDIAPDAPTLASPADGANGVAVSPVLTWNAIAGFGTNCLGNTNQFEVFLDPGNVDPTTSFGTVSEATLSKLIIGLASNTTFSWKVRALNGALFADSPVRTLTTTAAVGGRAVSPNFDADNGYPAWYRDDIGIMIVPCLDGTDPRCVLPGFGEEPEIWNPNLPTDFPDSPTDTTFNFPSEFFYWIAESDFLQTDPEDLNGNGNNGRTGIRFAVEGAFLNELPATGDQMVFGRIRVTGNELQPNSIYTVTHPYGVDTYETNDLGIITRGVGTEDIGCVASLCDYSIALGSRVFGAFLRHTNAPEGYLGDAISLNPIVGSPLGQNFFRIEGPGLPSGGLETPLFTVSGKVLLAPPPPPEGCVDVAPDAATLASPVNGATEVSTNPLLTWNAIASFGTNCAGGRNQFEVFLNEGNVDPTTSQGTVLDTQTSFNAVNLLPSTTYSWKVRASNLALSTDSEVRTFTTTATQTRATSPTLEDNGFPTWYQDDATLRVVACLDGTDPNCVLPGPGEELGFDPSQPSVLPGNFPSEFFYHIAESDPLATPGGGDVNIRYAVEGAFLGEAPLPGDQMVFGRIRVRGTGLEPNSTYTVTHAYGVDVYSTDENGIITAGAGTEDIGCTVGPCNFAEALSSRVFGGFLRMVAGAPVGYLGDGATIGEVTGSPLGQNFFRIEGPGLPAGGLETNLFTVSGKLFVAGPPVPDVTAPSLSSFSSTTADGIYGPGSEINITANFNEPLLAGSTAIVTLDNTIPIELVSLSLVSTTTLSGTYVVGPLGSGEDSPDLTVASIAFMNATDLAGNLQTSTLLPDSNIADTSDIVINTTTPPPPPGPTTGSITVIKDAVPDDVQDFGFRMRNGPFDENFSLDDDGNNANELSNTILFTDLAPGSYDLQETSLGSFVLNSISCPDPDGGTTIDLASRTATIDLDGGEAITCTFTNAQRNTISGMKFRDLNANSIKDAGEPGLPGWTIYLDENDNAVLDGGEPSVATDAGGNYQFIDVAGGTQNVREVLQAGWLQTLPVGGKYTVVLANNSFINQDFGNTPVVEMLGGSFTFSGESESNTSTATALEDITINVPTDSGISTIIIPAGTVISKSDGSAFDMALLGASEALPGSLSGLGSGTVVDGALQWGIPSTGLTFSQPITVSIFVGNEFNGQTLNILRSVSGTSDWTGDGIVAPGTCTVLVGLCIFQATKASFYIAAHTEEPAPTPTPAPGTSGTSSSSGGDGGDGGSASASSCNDSKPGSAPTLSGSVSGPNEVTLTWSKAADPVTYYLLAFGLSSGAMQFGNPNIGGSGTTSFVVNGLSGGTTYYFQVRAGNGCTPGDFSNEVSITPGGVTLSGTVPAGFTEGVLGVTSSSEGDGNEGEKVESSSQANVLGTGNVEIGGNPSEQAGVVNQSFLGFLQAQTPLLGILAVLALLFVLNLYFRRAS